MKIVKYITIKDLSSLLSLSESVVRIHLSCFESYRKPYSLPMVYFYNRNFLAALRAFYIQKSGSVGRSHRHYIKTVERIDRLMSYVK